MKKIVTKINFLTVLAIVFCLNSHGQIGARSTTFNPEVHGFNFSNTFSVEIINDIRMSGFCGGMVYTQLDYFKAGKSIPAQNYRPANGTPLYDYIWGRQRSSVLDNTDKWAELFVNPFGARTNEFFNWGLQGYNGGRLQELKTEIDKGNPVPLSLFKPGNGGVGPHHQVLAIGYKGGRYRGDLGNYKEELEILVCDPNFPRVTKVLKANPAKQIYYYKDEPDNERCQWQTYFVDRKYRAAKPSVVEDGGKDKVIPGMIRELLVEIKTGGDDLRGGNDNVSAIVKFKGGKSEQKFANINRSARWINNYTETVSIVLSTAVRKEDIESVTFITSFGGGIGGDNWNMDRVVIKAGSMVLADKSGAPLVRFTGDNKPYTVRIN